MATEFSPEELERISDIRRLLMSGAAKRVRESAHIRRSEVSRCVPCHPSALMRWEEGQRTPRPEVALRLADAYGQLLAVAISEEGR